MFLAVWVALLGLLISFSGAGLVVATIAIAPYLGLSWIFKNLISKLNPDEQFIIGYIELGIVFAAAFLAPQIFIADFVVELTLYIISVLQMKYQ